MTDLNAVEFLQAVSLWHCVDALDVIRYSFFYTSSLLVNCNQTIQKSRTIFLTFSHLFASSLIIFVSRRRRGTRIFSSVHFHTRSSLSSSGFHVRAPALSMHICIMLVLRGGEEGDVPRASMQGERERESAYKQYSTFKSVVITRGGDSVGELVLVMYSTAHHNGPAVWYVLPIEESLRERMGLVVPVVRILFVSLWYILGLSAGGVV